MTVWWSVTLACLAVVNTWLVGRKLAVGWLTTTLTQLVWMVYSTATKQWGFLVTAVLFTVMSYRNWLAWRRDERADEEVTA